MTGRKQQNLLTKGCENFQRRLSEFLGESEGRKLWLLPGTGFAQFCASPYTTPRNAGRDLADVLKNPFVDPVDDGYRWHCPEAAEFGFGQAYLFFSKEEIQTTGAPTGFTWSGFKLSEIQEATHQLTAGETCADTRLGYLVGGRLDNRFAVDTEKTRLRGLPDYMGRHKFGFVYWLVPESAGDRGLQALAPAGFEFNLQPVALTGLAGQMEDFIADFDPLAMKPVFATDVFRQSLWWANISPLWKLESTGEILAKKKPGRQVPSGPFTIQNDFFVKRRGYFLFNLVRAMQPSAGFEILRYYGVLAESLSEIADGFGLAQNRFHDFDIYYHSIFACDASIGSPIHIRFAALFHDLGKVPTRKVKENGEATFHNHEMVSTKITSRILNRSGFDEDFIDSVRFLVRNHMFHYTNEWTDKAVRRFVRKVENNNLKDMLLLRFADRLGSGKKAQLPKQIHKLIEHVRYVEAEAKKRKVTDLALGGKELMAEFELEPGPVFGEILRYLLAKVDEEPERNNIETLKTLTADYLAGKSTGPKTTQK